MEADETARALGCFRDANFRTSSRGNVGVETAEMSPDDLDLRRRGIAKVGEWPDHHDDTS